MLVATLVLLSRKYHLKCEINEVKSVPLFGINFCQGWASLVRQALTATDKRETVGLVAVIENSGFIVFGLLCSGGRRRDCRVRGPGVKVQGRAFLYRFV